jgi:hypothetical protein
MHGSAPTEGKRTYGNSSENATSETRHSSVSTLPMFFANTDATCCTASIERSPMRPVAVAFCNAREHGDHIDMGPASSEGSATLGTPE